MGKPLKQIELFPTAKPKKERTSESIQRQIFVLEKRVVSLIAEGNSFKRVFALNGKIQKLKFQLLEMKSYEFLAR